MTKEPREEVGTLAETCEPAVHLDTFVVGSRRGGIPERLCDMAMAPLLGIHIRRLGWEPFHCKVRMLGHIVLEADGSRLAEPIPDDDHRPGDVPREVAQGRRNIRCPDGMLNMALVDLAGQRQAHHGGPLPAFAHTP
jgi:hypothetical protein